MKIILLAAILLALTACSSTDGARTLLDRLEFEENEYGTFEVEGTVDVNPMPFLSTNMHVKLEKHKDKPDQ